MKTLSSRFVLYISENHLSLYSVEHKHVKGLYLLKLSISKFVIVNMSCIYIYANCSLSFRP
jgi:hypothetical protein